jgi:hypothetical protein
MIASRIGFIAITVSFGAFAQEPTPTPQLAEDPYAVAQEQALALGRVLGGMRRCEGDAWQAPFHEFMAAKRRRGLADAQTAVIAALVGAAESQAEPEMLECSAEGLSRRSVAIQAMRAEW